MFTAGKDPDQGKNEKNIFIETRKQLIWWWWKLKSVNIDKELSFVTVKDKKGVGKFADPLVTLVLSQ